MGGPFTYEMLLELQKQVDAMPPPAFFASSELFFADKATIFNHEGRDYVGAHPDFWAKIPESDKEYGVGIFKQEVLNIDINTKGKKQFWEAMIAFMNTKRET